MLPNYDQGVTLGKSLNRYMRTYPGTGGTASDETVLKQATDDITIVYVAAGWCRYLIIGSTPARVIHKPCCGKRRTIAGTGGAVLSTKGCQ